MDDELRAIAEMVLATNTKPEYQSVTVSVEVWFRIQELARQYLAQQQSRLTCDMCGHVEDAPFAAGDECHCGGKFAEP